MPAITRDAALAAADLPREKVEVPEWGPDAYVLVRALTSNERDAWETFCLERRDAFKSETGFPGMRASLLVRCLVDDMGERLFLDTDTELLGEKNGKVADRLWTVASRLSGLSQADIEVIKKN